MNWWQSSSACCGRKSVSSFDSPTPPDQTVVVDSRQTGDFSANDLKNFRLPEIGHQQRKHTGGECSMFVSATDLANVPEPARRSTSPSSTNDCKARATVGRETENRRASWASLGSRPSSP